MGKKAFNKIEQMLYEAPAFVNMIRSVLPEETFQAVLTNGQKEKIANGPNCNRISTNRSGV